MKTNDMTGEQISALADGELPEQHIDKVLAALRQPEARADWDLYHQIGDAMRSDDMAVAMSPDFAARMAARLDAEPTIIAPVEPRADDAARKAPSRGEARRWAVPSMVAAAAMASAAFLATPQLMVAMKGGDTSAPQQAIASADAQADVVSVSAPEGVVLRDPRIDDYLMAHQRISPPVHGTAQFARSAAFASEPGK